ncbi:MAG TPA: ATPase domain-containing protein [Longimicrobiales bacterium]|nr:ATPase domain-containing protein [Longimicrobiales bacterium]
MSEPKATPAAALTTHAVAPGRISTGNPVTDAILGGGFPASTINIVMGQPGTGKTIFVEQILFANAGGERPALFFTTLSEPLAKVVRFVQEFSFYDESLIGSSVLYDDIGADLAEKGIAMLVPRLKEAIKSARPSLIVIDSFRALHDLSDSAAEMRHLIHDVTGLLTAYETTAFLIGEYHQEDIRHHAEFAIADGVVELSRQPLGTRDERYFRVLKLRGSRYLEGSHAFRITADGLDVHPRLVTPRIPVTYQPAGERVPTGVPGLDDMLDGGLPSGSSTLLAGPSGSGKTTFALQFALEGVRHGEPALCVNFQENPTQLARTIQRLAGSAAADLDVLYSSPVELQIDSIIGELFRRIEAKGIRRVVVDAIGDLAASTSESHRLHDYLYALTQHLVVNGITSVFTFETAGQSTTGGDLNAGPISYMADNLILLDMRGEDTMRRTIRVLKARGTAHDQDIRTIVIGPDGVRVT